MFSLDRREREMAHLFFKWALTPAIEILEEWEIMLDLEQNIFLL